MVDKLRILGLMLITGLMSMGIDVPPPTTVSVPNNFWLCDTLLLVADRDNGLMVFSVADQVAPHHITNISVNRNSGLAASGNVIFANSNDSIVSYRLQADGGITRLDGIKLYSYYPEYYYEREYTPLFSCPSYPMAVAAGKHIAAPLLPFLSCTNTTSGGSSDAGTVNTGGSMAVFAVIDTFLYYVDQSNLHTVSIADPSSMRQLSQQSVGWEVETIFPTSHYLFIGGSQGMYMYDRSDAQSPAYTGMVSHIRSCDPVVVRGAIAYVTLRSGNTCGGQQDVLMSVDVSNPADARILKELSVTTPYGLAVGDSLLYVANGWSGFSLHRAANPYDLSKVAHWDEPATRDFIWTGDRLFLMGMENIFIYDVSDPMNPVKVGEIR